MIVPTFYKCPNDVKDEENEMSSSLSILLRLCTPVCDAISGGAAADILGLGSIRLERFQRF